MKKQLLTFLSILLLSLYTFQVGANCVDDAKVIINNGLPTVEASYTVATNKSKSNVIRRISRSRRSTDELFGELAPDKHAFRAAVEGDEPTEAQLKAFQTIDDKIRKRSIMKRLITPSIRNDETGKYLTVRNSGYMNAYFPLSNIKDKYDFATRVKEVQDGLAALSEEYGIELSYTPSSKAKKGIPFKAMRSFEDGSTRMRASAFPNFEEHVLRGKDGKPFTIELPDGFKLKGNPDDGRDEDFKLFVELAVAQGLVPEGTTHGSKLWKKLDKLFTLHHLQDMKTITFVEQDIHGLVRHSGGRWMFDNDGQMVWLIDEILAEGQSVDDLLKLSGDFRDLDQKMFPKKELVEYYQEDFKNELRNQFGDNWEETIPPWFRKLLEDNKILKKRK